MSESGSLRILYKNVIPMILRILWTLCTETRTVMNENRSSVSGSLMTLYKNEIPMILKILWMLCTEMRTVMNENRS